MEKERENARMEAKRRKLMEKRVRIFIMKFLEFISLFRVEGHNVWCCLFWVVLKMCSTF